MVDPSRILLRGLLCYGFVLVAWAADIDYLKTTIQTHFSENRHHSVNPDYKLAALDFIAAEFTRFGLKVEKQTFNGDPDNDELKGLTFTNVIGILEGSRFKHHLDVITAIGAHYDTGHRARGVDDNGSGVAAMLETARRLTSEYRDATNTVIFVAFDIKEYLSDAQVIGSQQFVEVWLPAWYQANYGAYENYPGISGFIILDTVMNYDSSNKSQKIPGDEAEFQKVFPTPYEHIKSDNFRGDFLAVISRAATPKRDSFLASGLQHSWSECGRPEFEMESLELPIKDPNLQDKNFKNFVESDHYHFWKNNYSAILITDSADLRGWMVHCYHSACDSSDVMLTDTNVAFLGKISDAMTDVVGKLSGAMNLTSAAPTSTVPSLRYSTFTLVLHVLLSLL